MPLRRHLLERTIELSSGFLDRPPHLLGVEVLAALAARSSHGLERIVQLAKRFGRLLTLCATTRLAARRALRLLPGLLLGLLLIRSRLTLQLLELTAELLGLATQLFLLPALFLGEVVAPVRLLREILLTSGELLELGNRFVNLLFFGTAEGNRRLGLVLVPVQVHLELEQLGEITAGETATATTALLKRNLNIGEDGFCLQKMLQRRLLGRHRFSELHLGQALGRRQHRLGRTLETLYEGPDLFIRTR